MKDVIKFDESNYPIVRVYTDLDVIDDKIVEIYIEQMTDFYKRNKGKNVVVIYDISTLKAVNSKGRIKIGQWLKKDAHIIKNAVAGVCYIQKNVFQKIILQGIFAVKSQEWKHKVFNNIDDAIKWGKKITNQ